MKVFGKNVFNEIIHHKENIKRIILSKNFKDQKIIKYIKDNNLKYQTIEPHIMDKMVDGKHQGIIVEINDYNYYTLNDIQNENTIIILDHLEDPHNFGAIIRTCEAAGIKSIIIPKDRSVSVNSTVMKTSAGALEHVKIIMVSNLVNTINKLKEKNYYVYYADMIGENYRTISYPSKICLVIGSEGHGVSKLIKESCDRGISIPMYGKVNSLNASVAAAILIYEVINR